MAVAAGLSALPLDGVRVLSVEHMIAMPAATMLLADYGADVIKVESPDGDKARRQGTIFTGPDRTTIGATFFRVNRGKKSVTINMKKPEGRDLFLELVKHVDVVSENLRPGAMEAFGITFEALREVKNDIVYVSFSGYGQRDVAPSPYIDWPAYGNLGEAAAGTIHIRGYDGQPPLTSTPLASGDLVGAFLTAFGIMLALRQAERTGEGQRLDMALYDCHMAFNEMAITVYTTTGKVLGRGGAGMPTSGGFPCKDGYISMSVFDPHEYARLCTAIGREDLAGLTLKPVDPARREGLDDEGQVIRRAIGEWTSQRTKMEAARHLAGYKVPVAPIRDAKEVVEDEHVAAREMLVEVAHDAGGTVKLPGNPVKIKGVKPRYGEIPRLGKHTEEVLRELLQLGEEDIAKLREERIV